MSNVGRLIHLTRTVKGSSIEELAAKTGRSPGHVQNIETGMLSGTPATLLKLAECLDISPTMMRDAYVQDAVHTAMVVWNSATKCQRIVTTLERKSGPKVVQQP